MVSNPDAAAIDDDDDGDDGLDDNGGDDDLDDDGGTTRTIWMTTTWTTSVVTTAVVTMTVVAMTTDLLRRLRLKWRLLREADRRFTSTTARTSPFTCSKESTIV